MAEKTIAIMTCNGDCWLLTASFPPSAKAGLQMPNRIVNVVNSLNLENI
jgi:hypothetical protein